MRKEELIKQVAESTGIAICEIRTVIEAALKETVDAVANGKLFISEVLVHCHPNTINEKLLVTYTKTRLLS